MAEEMSLYNNWSLHLDYYRDKKKSYGALVSVRFGPFAQVVTLFETSEKQSVQVLPPPI